MHSCVLAQLAFLRSPHAQTYYGACCSVEAPPYFQSSSCHKPTSAYLFIHLPSFQRVVVCVGRGRDRVRPAGATAVCLYVTLDQNSQPCWRGVDKVTVPAVLISSCRPASSARWQRLANTPASNLCQCGAAGTGRIPNVFLRSFLHAFHRALYGTLLWFPYYSRLCTYSSTPLAHRSCCSLGAAVGPFDLVPPIP